ncbi:unnamed protein product [Dibothriocephalus latus]|uniref:Uncharacterized protein n=1 Tax=Dibothriocephalus latus TaxID=60516 RepID=A0A3P7N6L1_DIBLA|nr:unnamed protein product [Dibothriocephalus latus]
MFHRYKRTREFQEGTKNLIRPHVSSFLMARQPREVFPKVERVDRDIEIVPADKGLSTVIMDRTDYLQLRREINSILLALWALAAITPSDRRMTIAQETALARFYGLPKVHKEGAPLRSIVPLKGTPTYELAKWLFRRLKALTADSETMVRSSPLTSLFTSIPQDSVVETVELLLRSNKDETENRLGHAEILQLLKFCLRTYFTFDETIYEQVKWTQMGSPISGLIAEAALQRLESLFFQHHRRDQVLTLKERLNSFFPDIQVTMKEKENNQLTFVDVFVCREDYVGLETKVFKKGPNTM